jgi:methylase of polypeptide subunit release factors
MDQHQEQALGAVLKALAASRYAFVAPTPETYRRVNGRPGNEIARNLRGVFGWSRPFDADLIEPAIFDSLGRAGALEAVGSLWKSRFRVSTLNGAPYLHSAYPTAEADAVFFGPDTYRFVGAALSTLPQRRYDRAVDIGCGSGAGLLAVAALREIGEAYLTDINPAALDLARVNAAHQRRAGRFVESNLFAGLDGDFDLILANPPYLADPAKRFYRDGGGDRGIGIGLRIVQDGLPRLAKGGVLFVYTGAPIVEGVDLFLDAVEQNLPANGFAIQYREIDPDVFGEELENPAYAAVERIAAAALTMTRAH